MTISAGSCSGQAAAAARTRLQTQRSIGFVKVEILPNAVSLTHAGVPFTQMLFDLGVDVISTDDLAGLRAFVAMRAATRRRSLFRWRMAPPLPSSLTVDVVVSRLLNRRGGNRGEGGNR